MSLDRTGGGPGEPARTAQAPGVGRPDHRSGTVPAVPLLGQHLTEEDLAAVLAVLSLGAGDPGPQDGRTRSDPGTASGGWTDRYRTLRNARGLPAPGPGRWRDPGRPG